MTETNSYEKGIVWMLLSATGLSLSFLFIEINLSYINYFLLLTLRFVIPLLCVITIALLGNKWALLTRTTHFPLQVLRSICILISQYGIAYYMTKNTLLNATVLLNASPLFIPIIEWIFLGHRPGKSTILGALLAFFGVILVLQPDRSLFTLMSGIGLLAACAQASSQVLYGLRSKTEHPLTSLFYLFACTSVFSIIIFLLGKEFAIEPTQPSLKESDWILIGSLVAMGVVTLLNQFFRGLAYRCARPSTLAPFLYFSVFVSALCDWLIFKELPNTISIIGICLIILGGVVKVLLRAHILKQQK